MHEFTEKLRALATITVEAEQDDISVRGNALASGFAAEDKAAEDAIIERLERGDVWAWAHVRVVASWSGFEGSDSLGACSYESEEDFTSLKDGYYSDMVTNALEELAQQIETNSTEQSRALADLIGDNASDIEDSTGGGYTIGRREYRVLTEDEADQAWDESLDSYLEECVYPELPEALRGYFDDEKWKRDAKMDGRGHSLSSYDGSEDDATDPLTGESFVVFRTN